MASEPSDFLEGTLAGAQLPITTRSKIFWIIKWRQATGQNRDKT
jgi:hypothetical protein